MRQTGAVEEAPDDVAEVPVAVPVVEQRVAAGDDVVRVAGKEAVPRHDAGVGTAALARLAVQQGLPEAGLFVCCR